MKSSIIHSDGDHRWLVFARDPERPENVIDTNQYVVCAGGRAMLLDPGGMELFPTMLAALTQQVEADSISHLFISHQDPDVSSSLPLWRQMCPSGLQVLVPWMWTGFVSHFDRDARFVAIPDEGLTLTLGGQLRLEVLPAHYLHSPGNYVVYDPKARVLFSGDIGAALVPEEEAEALFVEDFGRHVPYMEGFHRRWMGSPQARDAWIDMVSRLDIDILAPQHGKLFRGGDVRRFLEWFGGLEVGSGIAAMRRDD